MEQFNSQPKSPEIISENILDMVKTGKFNKNQIDNLISKLQHLKTESVNNSESGNKEIPEEQKTIQDLEMKANELKSKLPDNQANTRSQATQDLLDFAAEVYDVPKYADGVESGKYISWLQDLGTDGYNASQKLNAPKQALDELLKYVHLMKEIKK